MNHDNINDRVRDGAHAAGEQAKSLADTAVQAANDQAVRKVKTGRNAASDYFHSLGDAAGRSTHSGSPTVIRLLPIKPSGVLPSSMKLDTPSRTTTWKA
jgi:hypothetical protein